MRPKINVRALVAGLCASFFILFHVSYYAGSAMTETGSSYGMAWEPAGWSSELQELPKELLMTHFDSPFMVSKLSFCEVEGGPRYWNPFRGLTYRYSDADAEVEECNLSEYSGTLALPFLDINFTQNGWNPESYWQGYEVEGFMRGMAGSEVPNLLFFLIQYSLAGGFLWSVFGKETSRSKKKSKVED